MNINIAFNTIMYIMVFLFPGILFRRAFFSGNFNNRFDSGNPFERLMWNMLCSVMMLVWFYLIVRAFNSWSPMPVEFEIGFDDISDTFICIYESRLPSILLTSERITQTVNLLLAIYVVSLLTGFVFNKVIFYLGLERRFSFLQFQSQWQYLTSSSKQNNLRHSFGDIFYTKVDVMNAKEELFTGRLHMISYDKDGKVEAITLRDAYRFNRISKKDHPDKAAEIKQAFSNKNALLLPHSETASTFVYRKRIQGDLFTVFNGDLNNISITYVKISNVYRRFQKVMRIVFSILLLLMGLASLVYAVYDFHIYPFSSTLKRVLFCILSPLFLIFIGLLLNALFNSKMYKLNRKKYKEDLGDGFLLLIMCALPYLFIFDVFQWWLVIIIMFVYATIMGNFLSTNKKK